MIGGILGSLFGSGILSGHSSMGGAASAEEIHRRQFEAARQFAQANHPSCGGAALQAMRARATMNANAGKCPVTIDVEGEIVEDKPNREQ